MRSSYPQFSRWAIMMLQLALTAYALDNQYFVLDNRTRSLWNAIQESKYDSYAIPLNISMVDSTNKTINVSLSNRAWEFIRNRSFTLTLYKGQCKWINNENSICKSSRKDFDEVGYVNSLNVDLRSLVNESFIIVKNLDVGACPCMVLKATLCAYFCTECYGFEDCKTCLPGFTRNESYSRYTCGKDKVNYSLPTNWVHERPDVFPIWNRSASNPGLYCEALNQVYVEANTAFMDISDYPRLANEMERWTTARGICYNSFASFVWSIFNLTDFSMEDDLFYTEYSGNNRINFTNLPGAAAWCIRDCGPFCLSCGAIGCGQCVPGKIPDQNFQCVDDANNPNTLPKPPHGGNYTCAEFNRNFWLFPKEGGKFLTNLNYSLTGGTDIRFPPRWTQEEGFHHRCSYNQRALKIWPYPDKRSGVDYVLISKRIDIVNLWKRKGTKSAIMTVEWSDRYNQKYPSNTAYLDIGFSWARDWEDIQYTDSMSGFMCGTPCPTGCESCREDFKGCSKCAKGKPVQSLQYDCSNGKIVCDRNYVIEYCDMGMVGHSLAADIPTDQFKCELITRLYENTSNSQWLVRPADYPNLTIALDKTIKQPKLFQVSFLFFEDDFKTVREERIFNGLYKTNDTYLGLLYPNLKIYSACWRLEVSNQTYQNSSSGNSSSGNSSKGDSSSNSTNTKNKTEEVSDNTKNASRMTWLAWLLMTLTLLVNLFN